jgi:hypothetical protein
MMPYVRLRLFEVLLLKNGLCVRIEENDRSLQAFPPAYNEFNFEHYKPTETPVNFILGTPLIITL